MCTLLCQFAVYRIHFLLPIVLFYLFGAISCGPEKLAIIQLSKSRKVAKLTTLGKLGARRSLVFTRFPNEKSVMSKLSRFLGIATAVVLSLAAAESNAASIFFTGAGANTLSSGAVTVTGDVTAGATDNGALTATSTQAAFAKPDTNHGGFESNWFAVADGGGAETYSFSITLTNRVGQGTESPSQPAAVGDNIQNIEFEILASGGTPIGTKPTFVAPPSTGPAGHFLYTNGAGNQVLRFGGIAGGGIALAQNAVQIFNFSISVPDVTGSWSIRTTANPEPGTLAMSAIAMGLFGGGYRRRKKKLQQAAAVDGENAEAEVVA